MEIKRESSSNYQINIADFYNIPIDNVKKCLTFLIKKSVLHYENLQIDLRLRLKLKKNPPPIRIQPIKTAKSICLS